MQVPVLFTWPAVTLTNALQALSPMQKLHDVSGRFISPSDF